MIKKIFFCLSLQHILCCLCLYGTSPHFALYDDLNFILVNKNSEKSYIQSGSEGNILVWEPNFIDEESGVKEKFNVSNVHKHLESSAKKIKSLKSIQANKNSDKNVVTASLTFILQKEDKYYAIERKLLGIGQKKKPPVFLGFVSGTKGVKGDNYVSAQLYSPSKLLTTAYKRFNLEDQLLSSNLTKFLEEVQKIQESKKEKAINLLKTSPDVIGMEETLQKYDSSINTDTNIETKNKSIYRKSGGYGSVTDSEQFLLQYLEEKLVQPTLEEGTYSGIYSDTLNDFQMKQRRHIQKKYAINYTEINDSKDIDENKTSRGKKCFKDIKNFRVIGAFLHLHSTREPCEFCGESLRYELYNRKGNFVSKLKNDIKKGHSDEEKKNTNIEPFFFAFMSYSQEVSKTQTGNVSESLRPKGVISGKLFQEKKGQKVDLNKVMNEKLLPLSKLQL